MTADTLELVELFQNVAHSVGSVLQRPLVTYANGEVVVITFDPDEPLAATRDRGQSREPRRIHP